MVVYGTWLLRPGANYRSCWLMSGHYTAPTAAGQAADCHPALLLTAMRFSKNNPVTVLAAAMMGHLPFRIDNRPFPDLDNAVASCESRLLRGLNKLHMRPLIPVVVNIISDFGEKHPLLPQYPICLAHERRIGLRKTCSRAPSQHAPRDQTGY